MNQFLSRFPVLQRVFDTLVKGRKNPENLDLYKAAGFFHCRRYVLDKPAGYEFGPKDNDAIVATVDAMSRSAIASFVQKQCNLQIVGLFQGMFDLKTASNANIRSIYESTRQSSMKPELYTTPPPARLHSHYRARMELVHKNITQLPAGTTSLRTALGFELRVRQSDIPNAGDGVFLESDAAVPPGTVVALFAGDVHLLEHLNEAHIEATQLLLDPDFMLMARTDGHIIDGRTADRNNFNPYAFAQLVNHPPRDAEPNVMAVKYDFPADILDINAFPGDLRELIPNRYFKKPSILGGFDR